MKKTTLFYFVILLFLFLNQLQTASLSNVPSSNHNQSELLQISDTIPLVAIQNIPLTICPWSSDSTEVIDSIQILQFAELGNLTTIDTGNGCLVYTPDVNQLGNDTVLVRYFESDGDTLISSLFIALVPDTAGVACIGSVNVSLETDCQFELIAEQVLTGNLPSMPNLVLDIEVQDDSPGNGPLIDGCGTFIYAASLPDGATIEGFLPCWGLVRAEDRSSPELADSAFASTGLLCDQIIDVDLNELPATISRCYRVSREGTVEVAGFEHTALGRRLLAGGELPRFFDGCSAMEICVNDLVPATDACDDVVITRVFTATDGDCLPSPTGGQGEHSPTGGQGASEPNAPTVFSYQIIFTRPDVDSVQRSATLAEFSCFDVLTLLPINQFGNQNPVPAVEDYPFVVRADGTPVCLDETFCNLGATFEDGPRIITCGSSSVGQGATYKFVRTWTVIDWCEVSNIRTFTQLVKVGDFDAPVITPPTQDLNFDGIADAYPLFYSTNTSDCRSIFVIPGGSATDACDNSPTVSAVIYPFGDTLALDFGPYAVGSPTFDGIPRGTHTIRYTASDDCGNESILDVPVTIGDATAPVAICEDGLNISIGGPIGPQGGSAQLCADDIDRASYDDCSDVALRISRVNDNNEPIDANGNLVIPAQNAYVNCITLTCADLGNVRVSLRVTDDGNDDGLFQFGIDNSNFCWLDVLVEDKTAPICIAPAPQTINCNDLSGEFPDDLNLAVATDPEGTFALLNDQFGAATGLDNCPDPVVTQSVVDNRNSCGVGTIVRTFTVTDGEGFTSPPNCGQLITVQAVHDYTVVFPGDQESDQCIEPDYNAVTYTEFGCDLLTVSTSIDTFSATADECYKLRITYEVLNWCEYNTLDAPYMIPRDADNDGILDMDTTVLHVVPRNAGLGDDLAYLDRDVNRANFNTIANLDNGDPNGILPGSEAVGYGNDGSRGAFLYQQFIKVYDDTPPTLVVTEPDSAFCSFAADCTGDVELTYAIDDECSPASVDATVELDAFVNPGADGVYTLADFVADGGDVTSLVTDNEDGTFTVNLDDLPIGEHAIRIRVTDGCGNVAVDLIEFEVVDCKAPTPICINGLTITMMPTGVPGLPHSGMAVVWASDVVVSGMDDCSGPVELSIYIEGLQPAVPNPLDSGVVFNCFNLGAQRVRVFTTDRQGNSGSCITEVLVQNFNEEVCNGFVTNVNLNGAILTPQSVPVNDVEVSITPDSGAIGSTLTIEGVYQFNELTSGLDYTVAPDHDPGIDLNRVTTADLISMSRHIIGVQYLDDVYRILAADVSQDGVINILDMIMVRRVILGLEEGYPNTNSWRFYVTGPQGTLVENWTENNLIDNATVPDFTAVEMGNVNGSTYVQSADYSKERGVEYLSVLDQEIESGKSYTVQLDAEQLTGMQATLAWSSALALNGVTTTKNELGLSGFAWNDSRRVEGYLAFSYVRGPAAEMEDGEVLTLKFRANQNGRLGDYLQLSDRITKSIGYLETGESVELKLDFAEERSVARAGGLLLGQNQPNPMAGYSTISLVLPSTQRATLLVHDQNGRLLKTYRIDGQKGRNQLRVERSDFPVAGGLVFYTLVAKEGTLSRKMLLL